MSDDKSNSIVVRYADETDLDYARRCATLPSTEAVGEVRRRCTCAPYMVDLDGHTHLCPVTLDDEGWLDPLAAEKLFEQRDTAITEATKLRAEVDSAWENLAIVEGNLKAVIEQLKGARDTAIRERDEARNDVLARDYWARDVVFRHELDGEPGDDHFAIVAKHLKRARAERDQAIADLAAFSQEVARLYEVEREAERMRPVVEAAKAWALAIFGEDWVQIPGDEDHYGETELTLAEAVDAYTTREASE